MDNNNTEKILIIDDTGSHAVRVLIVDDSPIDRYVLRALLQQLGAEIVGEASDGESALRLYKETCPDITMLDIIMPNDSGIYILKKIMEFDKKANIIMCTSEPKENLVINSTLLGAKNFLAKPVDIETLTHKLKSVLYHYK